MGKSQLIPFLLLVIILTNSITYPSPSPPPLAHLLSISITHLHSLIIQTRWFSKPPNNKMTLSFKTLNTEIKPTWYPIRISLFLQIYHICIVTHYPYIIYITTLKITTKSNRTYLYHPTLMLLKSLIIFIHLPKIKLLHWLFIQ